MLEFPRTTSNPDPAAAMSSPTHVPEAPTATPNSARLYRVHRSDLPLHCPLPSMSLWNSHPRVFLPIEATGRARCPYCSAEFVLEPDAPKGSPPP